MPIDSTAQTLTVVDRVIELLKYPDQWCQNKGRTETSMCLAHAIDTATALLSDPSRLWVRANLLRAFHEEFLPNVSIVDWNDYPGRTHIHVIDLLTKVRGKFVSD